MWLLSQCVLLCNNNSNNNVDMWHMLTIVKACMTIQ